MPMAGTPAEYERMALKSIEKAAEDVSDTQYHLTRATIFANLAQAAAIEGTEGDAPAERRRKAASGTATGGAPAAPAGDTRNLPAVRAS